MIGKLKGQLIRRVEDKEGQFSENTWAGILYKTDHFHTRP